MVSVRRVAPVLLLALALPMLAAPPKTSSRPPQQLHKVGDHWTAYDPPDPATYAANAKTHLVKAGETLWGLAQQYYGNPLLWPQLWEANTWITDAHWIYPGDVLLVEGETQAAAAATADSTLTKSEPETTEETAPAPEANVAPGAAPVPLATEADLYCYGYIGDPKEPMPNRISSFEDTEVMYMPHQYLAATDSVATGDLVFIDGGTATGLAAGETYIVVEPGDLVKHPQTGAVIGQHYDYRGQIRILCAEDRTSRAIVTQACKEIHAGARLKPLPQLPIPIARIPDLPAFCDPQTGRKPGVIVSSQGWEFALGVGNLVQINLGSADQIQPGDFLTVFRPSPVAGQPNQVLGEIAVLTTEPRTATARVVAMRRAMLIGDQIEAR